MTYTRLRRDMANARWLAAQVAAARLAIEGTKRSADADELRRQAGAAREQLDRLAARYPESEAARAWTRGQARRRRRRARSDGVAGGGRRQR